jgi:hypothetical protein
MPKALVEPRGPPAVCPYMGPGMSMFDRFSLKENGRILSLKHLERIKVRLRPTWGYLPTLKELASRLTPI